MADDVGGVIAFIAEHTSDVIVRVNAAGVMTYVSPTIRRYGYEPEAFVGSASGAVVHPDDLEHLAANNRALLKGENDPAAHREHRFRTASGEWIWMEGNPH